MLLGPRPAAERRFGAARPRGVEEADSSGRTRNRLKRLVRESFRENHHRLAGLDLVVIALGTADREPGVAVRASLERHWTTLAETCRPR